MPRQWIKLKINLLPIIISEVDKVTEIYLSKYINISIKLNNINSFKHKYSIYRFIK
jgi:hypothetical protein